MLRAIAAAKKKNDRIDASKICDCLRCDFLPECCMASTAIRERRRTLRYRNLPQREVLAMLFLNLHFHGLVVAEIFWGLWLFPLARLVYRSRFLPRFLGVWLALAGFAWVILSLTAVLLPKYYDKVFTYCQPASFGEVALMLWLVIKGARPPALDATALSSAAA